MANGDGQPSKAAKNTKKQFPCDQRVRCGYPECSFYGRLRSLNRHQSRRHPNQPIKIANAAFGEGGSWSSWRVSQAQASSQGQGENREPAILEI